MSPSWPQFDKARLNPYKHGVLFSSPVRKYRKSYCSHGGVGVGVAQMLKFLVKVFRSLHLLKL